MHQSGRLAFYMRRTSDSGHSASMSKVSWSIPALWEIRGAIDAVPHRTSTLAPDRLLCGLLVPYLLPTFPAPGGHGVKRLWTSRK